jgi:hypothetical protein
MWNDVKKGEEVHCLHGGNRIVSDNKRGIIRCVAEIGGYILGDDYIYNYDGVVRNGELIPLRVPEKVATQLIGIYILMNEGQEVLNNIERMKVVPGETLTQD